MRRASLAVLALAILAFSSCSAALRLSGTAPALDNDGSCTAPALSASPVGLTRTVHFSWSGPVSGEDSVRTTAGSPFAYTAIVLPGVYTVRCWASSPNALPGCDTTLVKAVTAPPWRVAFQ